MMQSNFEILKFHKLSPVETSRRLSYLENTLHQLEEYHKRAKDEKKEIIKSLIYRYECFVNDLQSKLETKGEIL